MWKARKVIAAPRTPTLRAVAWGIILEIRAENEASWFGLHTGAIHAARRLHKEHGIDSAPVIYWQFDVMTSCTLSFGYNRSLIIS